MTKLVTYIVSTALLLSSVAAQAGTLLQPFEPDSFAHIVEKQKGKPFVMIVWSLDCEFCQASLKTLATEKRKRKDLNIVTVSTDSAGDPQSADLMQKRLSALQMTSDAWAFGAAPSEQLRYVIDPKWHGEMPRSYWFNAKGEKIAYSGVLTSAAIEKLSMQSRK
jgi:hypothetical protein